MTTQLPRNFSFQKIALLSVFLDCMANPSIAQTASGVNAAPLKGSSPEAPASVQAPPNTNRADASRKEPIAPKAIPASQLPASAVAAKNPLDRFMETTAARGVTIIDSYSVKEGIVYIALNEESWTDFDKDHKHRLCDLLAQTDFVTQMNVAVAYLTLDNGRTTVGNISRDFLSPHCIFNESEDYWKNL